MAKVDIRQVNDEKGIFTEILIDGHKIDGVRNYELKQKAGKSPPYNFDKEDYTIKERK